MKKITGIVLIIVGIISTSLGAVALFNIFSIKPDTAASVSIIGGADGPTTIFLMGKLGAPLYVAIIGGIAVFIIGLLLLLLKKEQK